MYKIEPSEEEVFNPGDKVEIPDPGFLDENIGTLTGVVHTVEKDVIHVLLDDTSLIATFHKEYVQHTI